MATSILSLEPDTRARVRAFLSWLDEIGVPYTVTSTRRSYEEQRRLYEDWLARGKRGLPAAPPGQSTHELGYAMDLYIDPTLRDEGGSILSQVGRYADCFGLKWAGAHDRVHFDVWGWGAWARVLRGQDPGTTYRC